MDPANENEKPNSNITIKRGSLDLQEIDKEAVTLEELIQIKRKKGMQEAREFFNSEGDEILNFIDVEALDDEQLKTLEFLIKMYQDVLRGDQELNKQIAKNQKTQQKIFFFFCGLFYAEIIYSLVIGSRYPEPFYNTKMFMLIFLMFFMGLAYCVFRK